MFPDPGAPLLPDVLRPMLGRVRVPASIINRHGLPSGLTLGHLNDRVWTAFPARAITPLAVEVVKALRAVEKGPLLALEEPIFNRVVPLRELADLGLGTRGRNALVRGGFVSDGAVAWPVTLETLTENASGVGAMTLLDLLTVAQRVNGLRSEEAASPTPAPTEAERPAKGAETTARRSPAVARAASVLARRRWRHRVHRADPRLGAQLSRLHPLAHDASEAGELLTRAVFEPAAARRKLKEIRDFVAAADALRRGTLQDELDEIVASLVASESGKRVVLTRLGLGGEPPVTLQEAGDSAGVSRERARQLEQSFLKALLQARPVWTPILDRAAAAVADALPLTSLQLHKVLTDAALVTQPFSAQSLVRALEVFGKKEELEYDSASDILASRGARQDIRALVRLVTRVADQWGVTTVDEVRIAVDETELELSDRMLKLVLPQIPGFERLDEEGGWFWLRGRQNKVLTQVQKIMSVAGSIDLGELRAGVGRHYRMQGFRPPRHVLAELCVASGLYTVRETRVLGGPQLPDWERLLGGIERTLVEVLFDNGYVMRRSELEEIAVNERGINRSSFYVYIDYSPLIERYARGVYGLRGAPISAAQVEALIPTRTRTDVLKDHGWCPDGRIWIGYRLSPATVNSGVLAAPSAVRELMQGEFVLEANDRPVGTVVVDKDRMWGISPFFRRWGVEAGDFIVLTFDTARGRATVEVGDEELLARYQTA